MVTINFCSVNFSAFYLKLFVLFTQEYLYQGYLLLHINLLTNYRQIYIFLFQLKNLPTLCLKSLILNKIPNLVFIIFFRFHIIFATLDLANISVNCDHSMNSYQFFWTKWNLNSTSTQPEKGKKVLCTLSVKNAQYGIVYIVGTEQILRIQLTIDLY